MRQAKIGDDVFYFHGSDRRYPFAAKVARAGTDGSAILNVFSEDVEKPVVVKPCHHIDSPWHQEYPLASEKQGAWDFTLEPAGNAIDDLVLSISADVGGDVGEVFKRVRSKGVSRSQVESILAKGA